MPTNISKYLQLSDFILLEYEFNRDAVTIPLHNPYVIDTCLGTSYFYEGDQALGITNNILSLNSVPINSQRSSWYIDDDTPALTYPQYWDSSVAINTTSYACDTVKLHIVSGYNFDDIGGFLLQTRAMSSNGDLVDLANFTYIKQLDVINGGVIKFDTNSLYLGNRFYDKYLEFKVPSIQVLGSDATPSPALGGALNIVSGSDVYLKYSTIFDIINKQYNLNEVITVQLPVTSVADNFNCFIAESTSGDYIEYYAVWNDTIIGDYINDIESGRIKLYTSNNPNDSFADFTNTFGTSSRKWVIIHEISVYEHTPGGTSLLTQKYAFTQDDNYSLPNYFRPILRNADIDSSYSIQYVCRLTNRMDGTQIIRKASFSSTNPKKYGLLFTRLNVENLLPYKVFNKIPAEIANINVGSTLEKTKYIKVYYDTNSVMLNVNNEVLPQGTGPLFLKGFDSVYKFKFEKLDSNDNRINVDLSGAFNYTLLFILDDNTKIEVGPTYSTNMNTTLGEIEFKLSQDQITTLLKQTNNNFQIIVNNPNGTSYSFYQGVYFALANQSAVLANYNSLFSVSDLQAQIASLNAQINKLSASNANLATK